MLLFTYGIPYQTAQFFGGTGMLIAVGVSLDTLTQIETYLLQRHYDGFLRKGRIRGRSVGRTRQMVDTTGMQKMQKFFMFLSSYVVNSGCVAVNRSITVI